MKIYWYAHLALGLAFIMSCLKRDGQSGLYPLDLSVRFRIFLYSFTFSLPLSKNISLSVPHVSFYQRTGFPFLLLMFLLSLFPSPLKCRNPSTAFYQAFRPSRLRGSKPVNDRYELGCVYMCVWPGLAD